MPILASLKERLRRHQEKQGKVQERDSKLTVLEELFNDLHNDRKRIYKLNFVRGIVFGLGSAIGGTVAVALVLWIASLFVNFPVVGQLLESTQQSIERSNESN